MQGLSHCAVLWMLAVGLAFGQLAERSTLVSETAKMPVQIQNGTFNQSAFIASVEAAVSDPALDFTKLNPLLAADLKNPDVRVRRYASLAVSQLSSRRPNSTEELEPLMPSILASIDDTDRGVQMGSILAATELRPTVPDSVVISLQSRFGRDDINNESYAILAGALTKIRPNDPTTDASVLSFLKNAKVSDALKAEAIHEVGDPRLSDSITGEISSLLLDTQSEQIRLAAILASERIGPRALYLEKESLKAIQVDQTKSHSLRQEASRALAMLQH